MTSVRNNAVTFIMGWFIFGFLNSIVLSEQPGVKATQAKTQNLDADDNSDYNYSDEVSPEQIKAPHKIVSTAMPYFDEERKIIYAKEDSKVNLDCPAKNYNESQHQILWFKDGKLITNGKNILSNTNLYQLDTDLNLSIDKVNEKSRGDYYCTVMPQNVSRHILLDIGDERPKQDDSGNKQPMITASVYCIILTFFVREITAPVNLVNKF